MGKIIALLLALLCLGGCAAPKPETQMVNPMEKVNGFEDINAGIGCNMHAAEGFEVENESFYLINAQPKVGQYRFDLDGITYTLRAATSKEDISGIYLPEGTFGQVADQSGEDTIVFAEGQCTRWFVGEMQYTLHSNNTNSSTEALMTMQKALQ